MSGRWISTTERLPGDELKLVTAEELNNMDPDQALISMAKDALQGLDGAKCKLDHAEVEYRTIANASSSLDAFIKKAEPIPPYIVQRGGKKQEYTTTHCSICGGRVICTYNYCPKCGQVIGWGDKNND